MVKSLILLVCAEAKEAAGVLLWCVRGEPAVKVTGF